MSSEWGDSPLDEPSQLVLECSPSTLQPITMASGTHMGKSDPQSNIHPTSNTNTPTTSIIDNNHHETPETLQPIQSERVHGNAYAAATKKKAPFIAESFDCCQTVTSKLLRHTRVEEADIIRFLKTVNMTDQILSVYVNPFSTESFITFTSTLSMTRFLDLDCTIRDCRVEWTPHQTPFTTISLMTIPTEMPDDLPVKYLNQYYGKVLSSRRKHKECLGVKYESLTRIYKIDLREHIPRRIRIAGYPTEVIYTGQLARMRNSTPTTNSNYQQNFPDLPSTSGSKPTPKPNRANNQADSDEEGDNRIHKDSWQKVYVGNVPDHVSEIDLCNLLHIRPYWDCKITMPRDNDLPGSYAIISVSPNLVDNILEQDKTTWHEKELIVQLTDPTVVKPWVDNVQSQPISSDELTMTKTEKKKRRRQKAAGNVSDSSEFVKPSKTTAIEDPITTPADYQTKQPQRPTPPTPNLETEPMEVAEPTEIQSPPLTQPEEPPTKTTTLSASAPSKIPLKSTTTATRKKQTVASTLGSTPRDEQGWRDLLYSEKEWDIPSTQDTSKWIEHKAIALFIKFNRDVEKAKKEGIDNKYILSMQRLKEENLSYDRYRHKIDSFIYDEIMKDYLC